jgi:hypothetical protein
VKRSAIVLVALCSLLRAHSLQAQQQFPTLERGLQPGKLYHFAGIDNVNIFNGNLTITLPIGLSYPLDGGLSHQLTLSYNSNLWDWEQFSSCDGSIQQKAAVPATRSNAGDGWILGYGDYIPRGDPSNKSFADVYAAADGGDHRFDRGTDSDPYTKYTADGSNLRLRTLSATSTTAYIDFPDGTVQRYAKNSGTQWDLRSIDSPRGDSHVLLNKPSVRPSQCGVNTDSWWTASDGIRTTYLCFKNYNMDYADKPMIDSVVLDGPQGQSTVYRFAYNTFDVQLPHGEPPAWQNPCGIGRTSHRVTVLKSITLPDQSAFKFEHEPDHNAPVQGLYYTPNLLSMTLPTGGRIEYDYGFQYVPPMTLCMFGYNNTAGTEVTFGTPPMVVTKRTIRTAPMAGGTPETATWTYTYGARGGKTGGADCRTLVSGPDGDRTDTHFSVWPGDMANDSPEGFKSLYYGFPYGSYDASQNRYLSTETFTCSGSQCTKMRSTYVRHDVELRATPVPSLPTVAMPFHRLASQRTFYHDDPANCVASGVTNICRSKSTEFTDWDGFGHYRQTTATHDFGAGGTRTEKTDWNKPGGVQRVIASYEPWTLDEYENHTVEEGGGVTADQACFLPVPQNTAQRFLRAKRTLKAATPGPTDLITLFDLKPDGNLEYEKYFGGDKTPLTGGAATGANLCTAVGSLSTPAYEIKHTWQNGEVSSSQYTGTSFLSSNLTIDRTGLVTESRDSAGVLTKYFYDSSGRINRIEPAGSAAVTDAYSNAVLASDGSLLQPASAIERRESSVTPIERKFIFDSLGRVWRETTQMPQGKLSLRESIYDNLGRQRTLSEWADLPSGSNELTFGLSTRTTFDHYDIFGRLGRVTSPDGSAITFGYTGERIKTRITGIWTGGPQDSAVMGTEEYDGFGRVRTVTQKSGPTNSTTVIGSDVVTTYGYDSGNRLTSVKMGAGTGPVQNRLFDYDGRGLLRWESQPESGIASYEYDARGHVVSKTQSAANSLFDLKFTYDQAERPTLIEGRNPFYDPANPTPSQPQFRPVKEFAYENNANNGTDLRLGKLTRATRHNYGELIAESDFEVSDLFEYADAAGRKTKRTTSITEIAGGFGGYRYPVRDITTSMEYNDLDLPSKMRYPSCVDCGLPPTDPDRYAMTRTYDVGRLKSISGYVSDITYWPNGMRNVLQHTNGIADTQVVTNMTRPSQISFGVYDRCVRPTFAVQPASGQVASSGNAYVLSVTVNGTGPFTYEWQEATNWAVIGTSASITVNPTATTEYMVTVTGPCGHESSQRAKVTVGQCATPSTGLIEAVLQPDGSWILKPNPEARPGRTFNWTRPPDANSLGTSETLVVGVLSTTATYHLAVTDSCGTGGGDVTINVPLPITSGLHATATGSNQVSVTWPAISGAAQYTVLRRSGSTWDAVGTTTAANFNDGTVAASRTYAYHVTSNNGGSTDYDVATTMSFTPAVSGQMITATPVNDMLNAVNKVRGAAGWPALAWSNVLAATDPLPAPGSLVLARHVMSCRARMNEALQALGVRILPYANADLAGDTILAADINEVQQRAQ